MGAHCARRFVASRENHRVREHGLPLSGHHIPLPGARDQRIHCGSQPLQPHVGCRLQVLQLSLQIPAVELTRCEVAARPIDRAARVLAAQPFEKVIGDIRGRHVDGARIQQVKRTMGGVCRA